MRTSVFHYPYAKVFRRTKSTLAKLGLRVTNADALQGTIHAESGFSFRKPALKVDLVLEEMENHDTRVTITGLIAKNLFFQKIVDTETSEAEFLENLSTAI
jgi:hypothetical protein